MVCVCVTKLSSAPPDPAQCLQCHTCHAKRRWMWDCSTPPRKTKVNVSFCHVCHAKMVCDKVVCERWCVTKLCVWQSGVCERWCDKVVCDKVVCERWCVTKLCVWQSCMWQSCVWKKLCVKLLCVQDRYWQMVCVCVWQSCVWSYCISRGRRPLFHKTKVNVSTTSATPATWNAGGCHLAPRLPRKVPRRHPQLKRAQARQTVPWVPRLPRKTKVDVTLRHACHAKRRWMWDCVTPATQSAAASSATITGPGAPHSAMSATPATQNEGGCEIVPRLPRKVLRRHPRLKRAQARHRRKRSQVQLDYLVAPFCKGSAAMP